MTAPYFDGTQACAGMPTNLFFAAGSYEGTAAMERAKTICRRCTFMDPCREYALTVPGPLEGIWGATSTDERKAIRRKRERRGAA